MLKLHSTRKDLPGREALLFNFSSKSRYAESFRTLRTNIYFSLMEKDLDSLMVTSSLQGEGKTNTVANLAFTIAQTGKRVLMVDADLRKPGLTSRFGMQKATGFSNLIGDILGRHINSGKIADYGMNDLIKLCMLQNRNCIISITDDVNQTELSFHKGKLIDVYWMNRPEEKKLASSLVREQILTVEEAEIAIGHQKGSVRRLGAILLTLGMVDEKALHKILSVQFMEAFRIAMSMQNAEFTVRTASEEELKLTGMGEIDFHQLSQEFISGDGKSFIKSSIDDAIMETDEKNLFFLSSGTIPPNPSELLGSVRTSYLIRQLKKRFDVIIIDSSPIVPASDALLLSSQVDGVVMVVKVGETDRKLAADAVQQLRHAKANILGVLLNQADVSKGSYYKYYQSYYGS